MLWTLMTAPQSDPFNGLPSYLAHATGPVLMAIIILGALREWWVTGKQYRRVLDEREQLLQMALRQADANERALGIAEVLRREAKDASS